MYTARPNLLAHAVRHDMKRMDQIARKFSRQMEGLEFLVHTGPPPRCLQLEQDPDDSSSTSSRLSEPFSDYAPLEAPAAPGLQGQLAKFSEPFQAAVREVHRTSMESLRKVQEPRENLSVAELTSILNQKLGSPASPVELTIPEEFIEVQAAVPRRLSDVPESTYWSMLEQYTEFKLSAQQEKARTQQQVPVAQRCTREKALVKCAAWLDCTVTAASAPTPGDDASISSTPEKHLISQDLVKSKWKREKNLIIACRTNTS